VSAIDPLPGKEDEKSTSYWKHWDNMSACQAAEQAVDIVGRTLAAVLLGFAALERQGIWERQRAGIALAKRRGKYQGRRKGSTKGQPNRAKELRQRGLSIREIAKALGVCTATASRCLAAQDGFVADLQARSILGRPRRPVATFNIAGGCGMSSTSPPPLFLQNGRAKKSARVPFQAESKSCP
jgi:hypothetical protein